MSEEKESKKIPVKNIAIIAAVFSGVFVITLLLVPLMMVPASEPTEYEKQEAAVHERIADVLKNYTSNPRPMLEKVTRNCYLQIAPSQGVKTACPDYADIDKKMIDSYFKDHPFTTNPSIKPGGTIIVPST